jgi:hypothetical protein
MIQLCKERDKVGVRCNKERDAEVWKKVYSTAAQESERVLKYENRGKGSRGCGRETRKEETSDGAQHLTACVRTDLQEGRARRPREGHWFGWQRCQME